MRAGHRIGVVLAAILLLPVIAAAGALLMGLPVQDELFYFSVLWLLAWVACYLAARAVGWIIARLAGGDPGSH
jgi:hypothetical protein